MLLRSAAVNIGVPSVRMAKRTSPQSQAIDSAVGKRVRLRRQVLKISQSALANKLGITFQQLQKCEQGINRIGAGRLYQIALILRTPIEYFFADVRDAIDVENPPAAAMGTREADFANQSARLVLAFSRIGDAETRRHIAELVDKIAES